MRVSPVSIGLNTVFKANNPNIADSNVNEKMLKGTELPFSVSEVLKAQILYQKPKNDTQYLSYGLNKKEIKKALKDENKMGVSFTKSQKKIIAETITKAKDSKLAVDNFNVLMNLKGKKLTAFDIVDVLLVSTNINNGQAGKEMADNYGFSGGCLDNKSIDSILRQLQSERELMYKWEFEHEQKQAEDDRNLSILLDAMYMDEVSQMS